MSELSKPTIDTYTPNCTVVDSDYNRRFRAQLAGYRSDYAQLSIWVKSEDIAYRLDESIIAEEGLITGMIAWSPASIIPDSSIQEINCYEWEYRKGRVLWSITKKSVNQFTWFEAARDE